MVDDKLIVEINRKDKIAWKQFFNSYYDSLFRHAFKILGEVKVAEDIVQDLFISFWDSGIQLETTKALTAYLYRSVTNRCLNFIRDKNREDARLIQWQTEEKEDASEAEFSSVVREELIRRLQELIAKLPEARRNIILMSMEGMSGEAIAQKLEISITTVKQQKYRAYHFLREKLGPLWIFVFIILKD